MRASGHGSRCIFREKMTLRATVRMKRFNLEAMSGLYRLVAEERWTRMHQ